LSALFDGGPTLPSGYEFTVYGYDRGARLATPVYPSDPGPGGARVFAFGQGATGKSIAFSTMIIATGDAVYNDEHGLSADQKTYFAGYQVVVSAPIFGSGNKVIGAISAIAAVNDGYFETDDGAVHLRNLADIAGTVLTVVAPAGTLFR
jgi:hypothetical protein